jgi:serine/threonine protein kinase
MSQDELRPSTRLDWDDSLTTIGISDVDPKRPPSLDLDDNETTIGKEDDDRFTSFEKSAPVARRERLEPGEFVVNGRYLVERSVRGGVEADAYAGRAVLDDRPVFIKHYRSDRSNKAAIEKKASMRPRLLRIDNPNCVRLLDIEIVPELIEVYDFVEGRPLSEVIAELPEVPDRAFVRQLVTQLAAGVHHLHELGLAHRDLKPDNILVVAGPAVTFKIGDYGVMSAVDEGGRTTFAGTRRYAPPESLRRSLLRDTDLMASDWWCLGRIIQEIVDGEHAYDKVAKRFSIGTSEDVQTIVDAILSEQERDRYGVRAGMVEWSDPEWQPLLRGLLTSKRQFRWGHEEVSAWLAGQAAEDSYDVSLDIEPYLFKGRRYDAPGAARMLAQAENWDEALRQILEKDGIVSYVQRELRNKRIETRLRDIDDYYDQLSKDVGSAIAEDLCTALALKVIAGETMPLTISGTVVGPALIRRYAADGKRLSVWALLSSSFIDRVRALDGDMAATLTEMRTEIYACRDLLSSWKASDETLYSWDRFVHYRYVDQPELKRVLDIARETFAYTTLETLNPKFHDPAPSMRELAMLAFVLSNAEGWGFVTKVRVEAGIVQELQARTINIGRAYGYAVLRRYHAASGLLFRPWWQFLIATIVWPASYLMIPFLIVLRKSLGRFMIDQCGEGASFRGRVSQKEWTASVIQFYGKNASLEAISRDLDECNAKLRAYARDGANAAVVSKHSPRFGKFSVIAAMVINLACVSWILTFHESDFAAVAEKVIAAIIVTVGFAVWIRSQVFHKP